METRAVHTGVEEGAALAVVTRCAIAGVRVGIPALAPGTVLARDHAAAIEVLAVIAFPLELAVAHVDAVADVATGTSVLARRKSTGVVMLAPISRVASLAGASETGVVCAVVASAVTIAGVIVAGIEVLTLVAIVTLGAVAVV